MDLIGKSVFITGGAGGLIDGIGTEVVFKPRDVFWFYAVAALGL